jgi:hypothetical protein
LPRRRNAEERARQHGDAEGKQQNDRVDADVRNRQQVRRQDRVDAANRPHGADHANHTANERQRQAFDQQLPQQSRPARAHRRAYRNLPLSRGGASEQQVRDIRTRDEKDAADGAEQHEQTRAELRTHERVGHRQEADAPVLHLGILLSDPRGDGVPSRPEPAAG